PERTSPVSSTPTTRPGPACRSRGRSWSSAPRGGGTPFALAPAWCWRARCRRAASAASTPGVAASPTCHSPTGRVWPPWGPGAAPAAPAGAGRSTLGLASALADRSDVELTLVSRSDDAERWRELAPDAAVEAVAPAPRPVRLAWEQTRLPLRLRRLPVDVHHGPHYTMPEASSLPRVVTIHDLTFFDHPEWHRRTRVPFFRRAIRVAARHAEALVCVSASPAQRRA